MKGRKTGGRDWKPGQTGNPSGRPKYPADVKEARVMNLAEASRILNKYAYSTVEEIKAAALDPQTPAIEMMILKVIVECTKTGDHHRLNFLFDRLIGKVTEKIKVELPTPTRLKRYGGEEAEVLGATIKSNEGNDSNDAE